MIPINKECECIFDAFRVYEHCYFCSKETNTWHLASNQPVCEKCSQSHNVSELPKAKRKFKTKDLHMPECNKQE